MELQSEALKAFDRECAKYNTFAHTEISNHVCTARCSKMEFSHKTLGKAFVCRFSRKVHICGCQCTTYEETNEGYVCYLTGHVLPYNVEKHYCKKEKGASNRFVVGTLVRMGKAGTKKKKRLPKFNAHAARLFLKDLFYGPVRIKKYNQQLEMLNMFIVKQQKESLRKGYVCFMSFHKECKREINRLFGNCASYPEALPDVQIEALLKGIQDFWSKQDEIQKYKTTNATLVFSAVCVSKLRTGFSIRGTRVFPMIPWINKHAPPDTFYSQISDFRCRAMSLMWRKILASIVDNKSMMPKRDAIFVLK